MKRAGLSVYVLANYTPSVNYIRFWKYTSCLSTQTYLQSTPTIESQTRL